MKKKSKMKIKYDPDADVLSASRGAIKNIDHAEEMGDIILHVNRGNEPILVEILNAPRLFHRDMRRNQKSGTHRKSAKTAVPLRKRMTLA